MRYTSEEIEKYSTNVLDKNWEGYEPKLFENLIEYTCPELSNLKYKKYLGFNFYGEWEYFSVTEDFFSQVTLRENLKVKEFGVYRRAISFVYNDELYILRPSKDDLVTIYEITKATRRRKVYREVPKTKVLDFIEGKYKHAKSKEGFGFLASLVDLESLDDRGFPEIKDLFTITVRDFDDEGDGDVRVYSYLPSKKKDGEILYKEKWTFDAPKDVNILRDWDYQEIEEGRYPDGSSIHKLSEDRVYEALQMLSTNDKNHLILITSRKSSDIEVFTITINYFYMGYPMELLINKKTKEVITMFKRENLRIATGSSMLFDRYEIMKEDETFTTHIKKVDFDKIMLKEQKSLIRKMLEQRECITLFKSILKSEHSDIYYLPEMIYEDIKTHLLNSNGFEYKRRDIRRISSFTKHCNIRANRNNSESEKLASIMAYKICQDMNLSDTYLSFILHHDLGRNNKNSNSMYEDQINEYLKRLKINDEDQKIMDLSNEYLKLIYHIKIGKLKRDS